MRRKILAGLAIVAVIIFALVGCGPSEKEFRANDSYGFQACSAYDQGEGAGGDILRGYLRRAADNGVKSTTPAIRESVRIQSETTAVITRLSDFRRACKKAGYNFK